MDMRMMCLIIGFALNSPMKGDRNLDPNFKKWYENRVLTIDNLEAEITNLKSGNYNTIFMTNEIARMTIPLLSNLIEEKKKGQEADSVNKSEKSIANSSKKSKARSVKNKPTIKYIEPEIQSEKSISAKNQNHKSYIGM